jgi:dicarboxylate transporter 10
MQIRAILMNASQLVSYDFFKDALLAHHIIASDGLPLHFTSSALAGTVATTICAPADVVKSRIMNLHAGSGESAMGVLSTSLKKEGPRFLFKGWLPAWSELVL